MMKMLDFIERMHAGGDGRSLHCVRWIHIRAEGDREMVWNERQVSIDEREVA